MPPDPPDMGVEPPLLLLNPGGEHEDAILPSQASLTRGPPQGLSQDARWYFSGSPCRPGGSQARPLCTGIPRSAGLCRVSPGPEAVVMLLHPDHSDVQRPGGYADRNRNNSRLSAPGQGTPAAASRTRSLRSGSAGTCRFTARCSVRLHKQLVVLGPRSTWQSSSGVRN